MLVIFFLKLSFRPEISLKKNGNEDCCGKDDEYLGIMS